MMKHPRDWGRMIIRIWAFAMIFLGMGMVFLEAFVHYRHYLSSSPVVASPWTIVPFIVGSLLATFGGLILQKGDVTESLGSIQGLAPYIAGLLSAVRPGGQRATDPPAVPAAAPKTMSVTPTKTDDESGP